MNINNHPFTDFLSFYESIIDRVIAFNDSKYTGNINVSKDTKNRLEEIQNLEISITELKNKIRKETNFNNKVCLNINIKELNDEFNSIIKII